MASPMSSGESFLDAHQNFVLKLKFVGEGDTSQIRRVRLPRIAKDGNVSYEELVGLAISFVVDAENPQNFEVKLSYQDVDDDTVVIGSSEELMDALDQFSEQRLLRLTAEVKRCTKAQPQKKTNTRNSSSRASPESAASETNNAATQAGNHGLAPLLEHVVESVVDIILKAAVAVNGHGRNATSSYASHPYYSPEGVPTASSEAAVAPSPAETEATPESRNQTKGPKDNRKNPTVENTDEKKPAPTMAEAPADTAENPSAEAAAEGEAEEKKDRPFIHGRHTCDACLTTPIIGKRYHAVNMADYDLCEKCFSNYKGNEIRFEFLELDRDRQLQDRWHRRRNRMSGNRNGMNRRFGPPGHHKRWGPGSGPRGGRGPHGLHARDLASRGQQGPRSSSASPVEQPVPSTFHADPVAYSARHDDGKEDRDLAMDLAIRRSLQDLMLNDKEEKTPKGDVEPSAPVEKEAPEVANTLEASDATGGIEAKGDEPSEKEDESSGEKEQEYSECTEKDGKCVDRAVSIAPNSSSSSAGQNDSIKDVAGFKLFSREKRLKIRQENPSMSLDDLQEAVEDHWYALSDEEREEYKKLSTLVEVRVPSDGSFASGISVIKGEEAHEEKEPTLEALVTSFSSDAAGNGDVADLLGSTLDKCAQAIDAMVSELDRTQSRDESGCESSSSSFVGVEGEVEDSDEDTGAVKGPSEGTEAADSKVTEETDGATILEPNDTFNENNNETSDERSEGDWQVVTEDHQINGDEELARAAQMVGSALFNSDIRSSGEIMSTLTGSAGGSEAFSYASSVPTSMPSIASVSSAQLQRWAPQLAQLHEMGFDDNAACIDILERLTAANIGVDSSDEISVEQVVNELWRN